MEDIIRTLYDIRNLAERKRQAEQRMQHLKSQWKNHEAVIETKDADKKTRLGFAGYLVVFVVLSYLIGRQVALRLFYDEEFIIAMMCGFPFALICLPLVRVAVGIWDRWMNKKNAADNQRNEEINKGIIKKNENNTLSNMGIMAEISSCEREIETIQQTLRNTAPWFPEYYLQTETVDFTINQLQTGLADSVNQALVHYEAMGRRF